MVTSAWHDLGVDDRAIVRAVLDGDRDAFRIVVDREQRRLFRVCLRILGRANDAEDVAQESFVIAYRSLRSFRGDGSLAAWLTRIATRQAFRHIATRHVAAGLDEASAIPMGRASSDPLALALASERQRAVRLAVAALPKPYREVIALRFFGELSLDEVARVTGRPINTVKTHVRRGLDRLRREITGEVVA
jgi:RNA polymerase sigma-70 factor (ECF subfamily)